MLISSTAVSDAIEAQVVVVGAGPAGMSLALDLTKRGIDVALLSSGSMGPDRAFDDLSRAESLPNYHADPVALEGRRLGGLSWGWGGRCLPLDPLDFKARPELDLPGWPIGRDDLMKHAEDAAGFLGLGTANFDGEGAVSGAELTLERWASQPSLAKRHLAALSSKDGPRVYLDMTCCGAKIDENGRITDLKVMTKAAKSVRVTGSTFVLAAGGIETARLLLWFFDQNGRSAPKWTGRGYMGHLKTQIASLKASPDIIGNIDYRETPECYVRNRLRLSDQTLVDRGLPNINFWLDNPPMSDATHKVPGLSLAYLALSTPFLGPRLLPTALRDYFVHHGTSQQGKHLLNVLRDPVKAFGFCYSVWKDRRTEPVSPGRVAGLSNGYFRLSCAAEERPRFQNGVSLGRNRDRNNMPRAVIRRDLHSDDIEGVIAANRAMGEAITSDAVELLVDGPENELGDRIVASSGDGYHQIGTARMGHSVNDSVTGPDGRVHGLGNLFIAGSSVFPRCGQANPTFSIVCQSLRLARQIIKI